MNPKLNKNEHRMNQNMSTTFVTTKFSSKGKKVVTSEVEFSPRSVSLFGIHVGCTQN